MTFLWQELTQEQQSILEYAFEQSRTISLSVSGFDAAHGLVKMGLGIMRRADGWNDEAGYFRINEQGQNVVKLEQGLDK